MRLLIALAAFGAMTAVSLLFVERILALLLRPVARVVFLTPTEAFFVRLKVAALAGVFFSLPVVLYLLHEASIRIARFVSPRAVPQESRDTSS